MALSWTFCPAQKLVGPDALIAAVGLGCTVTDWVAVAVQPKVFVAVTVKLPEVLTVIDAPLPPVLHW